MPAGSTSYGSTPYLANDATHTFIATLWGLDAVFVAGNSLNNNLQALLLNNGSVASATFRTSTSGTFAGIWNQPSSPAVVPGITLDTDRATFQVRVWDSKNGTVTTWNQALATPGEIIGYSDLFTVPYALGGTSVPPNPPPYLQGLQSFNIPFIPEPSIIALGVMGGGCLLLLRRP